MNDAPMTAREIRQRSAFFQAERDVRYLAPRMAAGWYSQNYRSTATTPELIAALTVQLFALACFPPPGGYEVQL